MELKFQPGGEKSKEQKKSGKNLIPDLESTGCSGPELTRFITMPAIAETLI